jgi:hypothetical protein
VNADELLAGFLNGGAQLAGGLVVTAGFLGLGLLVLVTYLAAAVRAS